MTFFAFPYKTEKIVLQGNPREEDHPLTQNVNGLHLCNTFLVSLTFQSALQWLSHLHTLFYCICCDVTSILSIMLQKTSKCGLERLRSGPPLCWSLENTLYLRKSWISCVLLLPWQLNNPVHITLTCSFIFGIQIQVQYQAFLVCLVYALYVNHMHHIFCQATCILKVPYNVKVDAHLFFIRSRVPHFVTLWCHNKLSDMPKATHAQSSCWD